MAFRLHLALIFLTVIFSFQFISVESCVSRIPVVSVASDAFTPVDLLFLANFERKLYIYLADVVGKIQDEAGVIKRYMEDYQESTLKGTEHLPSGTDEWIWATVVSSNPIIVYRMIRRILVDFPEAELVIAQQHTASSDYDAMLEAKIALRWPTIRDQEDVMLRILNIQNVYDLDVSKISSGESDFGEIHVPAVHCIELGRYALAINKFGSAVEWMNAAVRKTYLADTTITAEDGVFETSMASEEHDRVLESNVLRRSGRLECLWDLDLFQNKIAQVKGFSQTKLKHLEQRPSDNLFRAVQLCNGKDFQPKEVKAKLHCWYEKKKHSFYPISPMKMELLSADPYLVQVHDFLGSTGVINLLDEAILQHDRLLKSGPIFGINPKILGERKRRHAPFLLMSDSDPTNKFKDLSNKVECFTGHSRNHCYLERLQVTAYTFGNSDVQLQAPDKLVDLVLDDGSEVTSMMLFLNDVDLGGYVVFPKVGISVKPLKGSALFWRHNVRVGVDKKGSKKTARDTRLMYSECPIIIGKKWVAKKNFHSPGAF